MNCERESGGGGGGVKGSEILASTLGVASWIDRDLPPALYLMILS